MSKIPYANVVGCSMYSMVCTGLDIAQAVGVVSKYIGTSGKDHWNVVKWVFRYLEGTKDLGILFERKHG